MVFFKLQEKITRKSHLAISTDLSQFPGHHKIYVASTSEDMIIQERITEFDTKYWAQKMYEHILHRYLTASVKDTTPPQLLWLPVHQMLLKP